MFADLRQHVGLQIADILTNGVMTCAKGHLQGQGWQPLRQLMIRQREGSLKFISLGDTSEPIQDKPYGPVGLALTAGACSLRD